MKTFFCLILFALLAESQTAKKMEKTAAAQAWAVASISLPDDTPSVSGGGLITESETNGVGRKVWLTATQSGQYLVQGKTFSGDNIRLGEIVFDNTYTRVMTVAVFDSNAMISALPYFPEICSIEVLRIDKGKIERSSTEINPWQPTAKLQIGNEGISKDGQYYVSTSMLPKDAIVILGRSTLAEIQSNPFGSVVVLPNNTYLPPVGVTTLTVCSVGKCNTTAFERKLAVEAPGKG